MFEPKPQSTEVLTQEVTRQHIRRCCHYAGVAKKPAVLLIHESLGEQSLRDVTAVMTEGMRRHQMKRYGDLAGCHGCHDILALSQQGLTG